ncbi:MAG: hypothetical protein AAF585_21705, partial [Verrucomicrobiota bacterium]
MRKSLPFLSLLIGAMAAAADPGGAEESEALHWLSQPHRKITFAPQGYDLGRIDLPNGVIRIETTGTDPYLFTQGIAEHIDPFTPYRIAFQYLLEGEALDFQILYKTPSGLKPIDRKLEPAKDWRWFFAELPDGKPVEWLRFDFGNHADRQLQMRDCRLIKAIPSFDIR